MFFTISLQHWLKNSWKHWSKEEHWYGISYHQGKLYHCQWQGKLYHCQWPNEKYVTVNLVLNNKQWWKKWINKNRKINQELNKTCYNTTTLVSPCFFILGELKRNENSIKQWLQTMKVIKSENSRCVIERSNDSSVGKEQQWLTGLLISVHLSSSGPVVTVLDCQCKNFCSVSCVGFTLDWNLNLPKSINWLPRSPGILEIKSCLLSLNGSTTSKEKKPLRDKGLDSVF